MYKYRLWWPHGAESLTHGLKGSGHMWFTPPGSAGSAGFSSASWPGGNELTNEETTSPWHWQGHWKKDFPSFWGQTVTLEILFCYLEELFSLQNWTKSCFLQSCCTHLGLKAEPAAKARAEVWTPPMAPTCHADLILGLESRISGWILIPLKPLARVPLVLARSPLVSAPVELLGHPSIQNGGFSEWS